MNEIGKTEANIKIGGSVNNLGTGKQDTLNYDGVLSKNIMDQFSKPIENYAFGKIPDGLKPLTCIETELKNKDKFFATSATMVQGIINSAKVFNRN